MCFEISRLYTSNNFFWYYLTRRNFGGSVDPPNPEQFGGINLGGSREKFNLAGINFGGSGKNLYLAGINFGGFPE